MILDAAVPGPGWSSQQPARGGVRLYGDARSFTGCRSALRAKPQATHCKNIIVGGGQRYKEHRPHHLSHKYKKVSETMHHRIPFISRDYKLHPRRNVNAIDLQCINVTYILATLKSQDHPIYFIRNHIVNLIDDRSEYLVSM